MDVSKAERASKLIKELKSVELAHDLLQRAQDNGAHVVKIQAEDEAESERSVNLSFSAQESRQIFAAATKALAPRLNALKAQMAAL